MIFEDLLKNRRTIRNYKEDPVSVELIQEMIQESTLAPSAGNGQPWQFIIVNNKEMIQTLSDESKQNLLDRIAKDPNDYSARYKGMLEKISNVFYNAPSLVIIGGEKNLKNLYLDCALAGCYFMMAATSRNMGTCWVNLGAEIHDPELRKSLGMTDDFQIVAPITVGYPVVIPSPPKRNEIEILKVIN